MRTDSLLLRYNLLMHPQKVWTALQHNSLSYLAHLSRRFKPSPVLRLFVLRKLSNFQSVLKNRLMNFDETLEDWSTHCPLQMLLFFDQICPGANSGRAKLGNRGPFRQRTFSSDQKATAITRMHMHSNGLEACGKNVFLVALCSQIVDAFWRLCLPLNLSPYVIYELI